MNPLGNRRRVDLAAILALIVAFAPSAARAAEPTIDQMLSLRRVSNIFWRAGSKSTAEQPIVSLPSLAARSPIIILAICPLLQTGLF